MGRNRVGVFVPVVWGTWDRQPLLTAAIEAPVHRIVGQEADRSGREVVAIGGVADHDHVLDQSR